MIEMVLKIPRQVLSNILLSHAFCGSDSTSAIMAIGIVKALKPNKITSQIWETFYSATSSRESLTGAGTQLFLNLYNDSPDNIHKLRFDVCRKKLGSKKKVTLAQLPPTEDAAENHSLRCYFAIQNWLGNSKDPLSFGWKLDEINKLTPITTQTPPAPSFLVQETQGCQCQKGCRTRHCTCISIMQPVILQLQKLH